MEIINVMKIAHNIAKDLIADKWNAKDRGIKTYRDALSFGLKAAHKANKLLIAGIENGVAMNKTTIDLNGTEYNIECFETGDSFTTVIDREIPADGYVCKLTKIRIGGYSLKTQNHGDIISNTMRNLINDITRDCGFRAKVVDINNNVL